MIMLTLNDQFDFCAPDFLETLAGRIVEFIRDVADENTLNRPVRIVLNITPIGAKGSQTVIVGGAVVKDATDSRSLEEVKLERIRRYGGGIEEVAQ